MVVEIVNAAQRVDLRKEMIPNLHPKGKKKTTGPLTGSC
jgi:hypothetical protein